MHVDMRVAVLSLKDMRMKKWKQTDITKPENFVLPI